jgi:hypothetical protein
VEEAMAFVRGQKVAKGVVGLLGRGRRVVAAGLGRDHGSWSNAATLRIHVQTFSLRIS